jgi:hypothetical protein
VLSHASTSSLSPRTGGRYGQIEASFWIEEFSGCRDRNGVIICGCFAVALRLCDDGGWMESFLQRKMRRTGSSWMRH